MVRRLLAALGALAMVAALGCTTTLEPTGPDLARGAPNVGKGITQVGNGLGGAIGQVAKLLECALRPAQTTVQVVGPDGGTIWAGPHRLKIPAGALSSPVAITMVAPAEAAAVVEFSPHGLRFNSSATPTLTMNLAGCATPPVANLGIKYVTPDNVIIEALKSQWNGKSGTVAAPLEHFSRYAVAW